MKTMPTYLVSVNSNRDAESSGKTEVSQLDDAVSVDQQVLRFHIAMQHTSRVTKCDALQYLICIALRQGQKQT